MNYLELVNTFMGLEVYGYLLLCLLNHLPYTITFWHLNRILCNHYSDNLCLQQMIVVFHFENILVVGFYQKYGVTLFSGDYAVLKMEICPIY